MLTTPLSVKSVSEEDGEYLDLWQDGKKIRVPAPFRPYVISKVQMQFDGDVHEEQIVAKPLDTLEPEPYFKYSFPTVQGIRDFNSLLKRDFPQDERDTVFENHCPFIERVAVDQPNFFTQWPDLISHWLTFDIETLSKNGRYFDDIIAISVNNGDETQCFTGKEHDILLEFIQYFTDEDPDVVITYNGKQFDLPRILDRCRHYNIPTEWLGRDGEETWQDSDTGRVHRIEGRLNYDVWESVDGDQSLFGLKNKRLKTVAPHFGIPAIEEETFNTIELLDDIERLIRYCNSDVDATKALADGYLNKDIAISNLLKFPIDEIVNPRGAKHGKKGDRMGRARSGMATLIGRLITQRGMVRGGFVEAGPNYVRYPHIYRRESRNFQGAIVDIWQTGLFDDVLHVDFSGMYPSIQMSVNISPETVKLIDIEPYDEEAEFYRGDGIFCIVDKNLEGNAIIHVDQSFVGGIPRDLADMKVERGKNKEWKKESKTEDQRLRFHSVQLGIKILMNSVGFGVNAPSVVRYGSTPVAMLITGIARYMLNFAIKFIEVQGFAPIECDTDGIYIEWDPYFDRNLFLKNLNDAITEEVSKWGSNPVMEMEADLYKAGYWHKAKNYVLLDDKGDLKITGGAFKGSKSPKMMDDIRNELAWFRLKGCSDEEITPIVKGMMKIANYGMKEMTMGVTNSRAADDYETETMGKKLAKMAEKELGILPSAHTRYEYVYTKSGYGLSLTTDRSQLDYKRYRGMVSTMCENLGWGHISKRYIARPGFVGIRGRR